MAGAPQTAKHRGDGEFNTDLSHPDIMVTDARPRVQMAMHVISFIVSFAAAWMLLYWLLLRGEAVIPAFTSCAVRRTSSLANPTHLLRAAPADTLMKVDGRYLREATYTPGPK